MTALRFIAYGRPAPQGSKQLGQQGQMRESSPHLPAWRKALRLAAYEALAAAGVQPTDRPLFPKGTPIKCYLGFLVDWPQGAAEQPGGFPLDIRGSGDIDKLTRAVLDAMSAAGVWADDRQVVDVHATRNWATQRGRPGVNIDITNKIDIWED